MKVFKTIKIIIEDTEEIETLKNICELARRRIDKNKKIQNSGTLKEYIFVDEFLGQDLESIFNLMDEIFDL